MDHRNSFFKPLLENLKDKCDFGIYRFDKETYLNLKAENGTEVAVVVTTKFNPKNTVRIQFMSDKCTKTPAAKILTNNELIALENALQVQFAKAAPAQTSHNPDDYLYYQLLFPFTIDPNDVMDRLTNTLVTIFNTLK